MSLTLRASDVSCLKWLPAESVGVTELMNLLTHCNLQICSTAQQKQEKILLYYALYADN